MLNTTNVAEIIEAINEYIRSCCGVKRVHLAHIIQRTIIFETCATYPEYATPDGKMIARMLHLPMKQNILCKEKMVNSLKEHTAAYKIDNKFMQY